MNIDKDASISALGKADTVAQYQVAGAIQNKLLRERCATKQAFNVLKIFTQLAGHVVPRLPVLLFFFFQFSVQEIENHRIW